MKRVLSWLIALGLVLGISACEKKESVPLPKTGASEFQQQREAGNKLVRSERYYSKQYRSFSLAHDLDRAKAEYRGGVLRA
jgi:predicted small lipoprotein YifL